MVTQKNTSLSNPILWTAFLLYVIVLSYTMAHHEFWADELHSWNIAKASTSFSDLIANIQYEGHPPVWYIILWFISKFTHNITCIQLPQSIIICLVVFIVLFFSPFAVSTRILISFGYFFFKGVFYLLCSAVSSCLKRRPGEHFF